MKKVGRIFGALTGLVMVSCTHTSVMPLARDTFQITTSAAPACGAQGAQKVAFRRAAVETLRQGYDRFVVVGTQAANNVGVIGHTPVYANTFSTASGSVNGNNISMHGNSTTTFSGGQPIIGGTHDQDLVVKMFHETDPAGANAVSARAVLGEKWEELMKKNASTCF